MKPKPKKKQSNPQYFRFTEDNEWEGETWHFYIPVKGNEEAVASIRASIERINEYNAANKGCEIQYSFSAKLYTRNQIDALIDCDDDECSYMAAHNRLCGYLKAPKLAVILNEDSISEWTKHFYKGGIAELMARRKS